MTPDGHRDRRQADQFQRAVWAFFVLIPLLMLLWLVQEVEDLVTRQA